MNKRILIVDDDHLVLELVLKILRPICYVAKAKSGEEAFEILKNSADFAVVIADYNMPGEDGVALLKRIAEQFPQTVRILCTGLADTQVAIEAINQGQIYALIEKPFKRVDFINMIMNAIEKYNLSNYEKNLLENTFQSCVEVLVELLGMVDTVSFNRSNRMYRCVRDMVSHLQLPDPLPYSIAALLSQIGCVALMNDVVKKTTNGFDILVNGEQCQFRSHAVLGANLVAGIPRMKAASEMIRHQFDPVSFTVSEYKERMVTEEQIGAQLLAIAFAYDVEMMQGNRHEDIIKHMKAHPDQFFIPFIDALQPPEISHQRGGPRDISLKALEAGMVLAADIRTQCGLLIATEGQEVTSTMLQRIRAFNSSKGIKLPLKIQSASSDESESEAEPDELLVSEEQQ